jgi:hypothetical protein
MADRDRKSSDRIGKPDPENEPTPPKIGVAGRLGEVGEDKLEETQQREEIKEGIWKDRPPTPDEKPEEAATRNPPKPR